MFWLTLRDLQHRRWRTAATIMLISVVMMLLLLMTGLVGQFEAEPLLATERSGADHDWVVPAGTTGPFTSGRAASSAALPPLPVGATALLITRSAVEDTPVIVVGRDNLASEPRLIEGRAPAADGEAVVDETLEHDVGALIRIGANDATVVGLTEDATALAGVPFVFTSLRFAQVATAGGTDVVSGALVPRDAEVDLGPGWIRLNADQVATDTGEPLRDAISSIDLVRGLLWLITIIVIAATTYIDALERTRDIAVMKAVGARSRDLVVGLVLQSVIVVALALVIAGILQRWIQPVFPMVVRLPDRALWQIPLAALVVALLSALLGARKIANTPAQEAFS